MRSKRNPSAGALPGLVEGQKTRSASVDIGRAVAALLVCYAHIEGHFVREQHGVTAVGRAMDRLVDAPLGMPPHGYAHIAVGIFFLASGFVVTPIVLRMGGRRFAINRLFRIYPLLIFTVLLSAVALWFGLTPFTTGSVDDLGFATVMSNLTLANFTMSPFGALVGVAWTLAIEMLYYALLVAVLPLLRRRMGLAILAQMAIVAIAVSVHEQLGVGSAEFASLCAFVLVPILGQIVWAGWYGEISGSMGCLYLIAAGALFSWVDPLPELHSNYGLHAAAVGYALVIFLLGLAMESRLRENRFWSEMSERVYSLYLVHGAVAFPTMYALVELVPVWLAVFIGVIVTLAVVEFAYVLIERPSHNLGRKLSGRPVHSARPQVAGDRSG